MSRKEACLLGLCLVAVSLHAAFVTGAGRGATAGSRTEISLAASGPDAAGDDHQEFFALPRFLAGAALSAMLLFTSAPARADIEDVVISVDDKGKTTNLTKEGVVRGKRLFLAACASCHVGGGTRTNQNVGLSTEELSGAQPARNTIESMVDYMNSPTTYDGLKDISAEILVSPGPPPQAIIDQKWLWNILMFLLGVALVLRLIGLDIPGALLTGLMLGFSVVMTRDGMQEMSKYSLVYAVVCCLNFFFDVLPLFTELGGRVTRETDPMQQISGSDTQQTIYKLTVKKTPFFDWSLGFVYNVQSMAMIVSPIAMALGMYLSISAHNEIQAHNPLLGFDEEPLPDFERAGVGNRLDDSADATSMSRTGARQYNSFENFSGPSHKLAA